MALRFLLQRLKLCFDTLRIGIEACKPDYPSRRRDHAQLSPTEDRRLRDHAAEILHERRTLLGAAASGIALTSAPGAMAAALAAKETDYKVPDKITSKEDATTYNNFYEFGTGKDDPVRYSGDFKPRPWRVEIGGLVNKPTVIGIDDIMKDFTMEERVYRMRCVEAWSMVIRGSVSRWQRSSIASSPWAVPNMWRSKPSSGPRKCRARPACSKR